MHLPGAASAAGVPFREVGELEILVRADAQVREARVHGDGHDHGLGTEALGQPVCADRVRTGRDAGEDAVLRSDRRRPSRMTRFPSHGRTP